MPAGDKVVLLEKHASEIRRRMVAMLLDNAEPTETIDHLGFTADVKSSIRQSDHEPTVSMVSATIRTLCERHGLTYCGPTEPGGRGRFKLIIEPLT